MDNPPADTRSRILRAALDLFTERGYQRTSLREIAERLRLTKAAILYHFPSKEHLGAALAEPLVADLESLLDRAQRLPHAQARWTVIEGWVDIMLAHRAPLGTLYHDLAILTRGTLYQRFWRIAMRANDLIAGQDADRRERVRAVQAIAMVSDPVVFFGDVPADVLRADMLDGARRLFDPAAALAAPAAEQVPAAGHDATAAPARPRRAGRPRALDEERVRAARQMYAGGGLPVDRIARTLGVSRATVYRYLGEGEHPRPGEEPPPGEQPRPGEEPPPGEESRPGEEPGPGRNPGRAGTPTDDRESRQFRDVLRRF